MIGYEDGERAYAFDESSSDAAAGEADRRPQSTDGWEVSVRRGHVHESPEKRGRARESVSEMAWCWLGRREVRRKVLGSVPVYVSRRRERVELACGLTEGAEVGAIVRILGREGVML